MTTNFSPDTFNILNFSKEEASRLHCGSVSPLHLLLGILRHTDNKASQLLAYYLPEGLTHLKTQLEMSARQHQVLISPTPADMNFDTQANRVMRLCKLEASLMKSDSIEPIHVLLAILKANDNEASDILGRLNITYETAANSKQPSAEDEPKQEAAPQDSWDESEMDEGDDSVSATPEGSSVYISLQLKKPNSKTPALDNFGTDLTQMAADDLLDPVVGRDKEIDRVAQILNRRRKNNPILIGEPGVGKNAIVEGLAQRIVSRKVSRTLWNKRIVVLDLASVVAGTKYRGQFEERLRCIIKELQQNPDIIVFIDEIHTLVGAGNASGAMDAANMLKPALSRGELQCIGATTLNEFRKTIEKDGALERRFQKILVTSPTSEETLQILQNLRERYEKHHNVSYTDEALQACVKLTGRYVTDRSFPDKAIDVLDEAGSCMRLQVQNIPIPGEMLELNLLVEKLIDQKMEAAQNQDFEKAADLRDQCKKAEAQLEEMRQEWEKSRSEAEKVVVDEKVIAEVMSRLTGIPVQRIGQEENERLRNLKQTLQQKVIGQDDAVATVARAIQRSRVGLKDPQKPIGIFLFVGPTGVGKTYLAKCLAEELFGKADSIIRVDMSEYMEKHTVSRMVGAPPGYVGYDEGGQLTERVRRKPYSIVLLDEIEKAHTDVFNLLLQVMDEGRLTDGNGNTIDFRNTVIIMTSNCGTKQIRDFGNGVGFQTLTDSTTDKKQNRDIVRKAISKQFAPEFINRLDNIIYFDHLLSDDIQRIVNIEVEPLLERVKDMGHTLQITPEACQLLGQKGYDKQFGARPLKRAIQDLIEDPLCELLMSDEATEAMHLQAVVDEESKDKIRIIK